METEPYIQASMQFANAGTVKFEDFANRGSFSGKLKKNLWLNSSFSITGLGTSFSDSLISLNFSVKNSLQKSNPIGTKINYGYLGGFDVTGNLQLDIDNDTLLLNKRLLDETAFTIIGTLGTSLHDRFVFRLNNCLLEPFAISSSVGRVALKFKAYEALNGSKGPLDFEVWTTGYSGTSFLPN